MSATRTPLTAVTGPRSDGHQPQLGAGQLVRPRCARNALLFGARDVDQEQRGRALRNAGVDFGEDARRGAGQGHQQGQAEAERDRQPAGCRAGPVERGDAEAGDRPAEMLRAARDRGG